MLFTFFLFMHYVEDLALEPVKNNPRKCGCYIVNRPMLEKYPNQHIMMPLKQSEYFLEIVNSMVNVSLTQSYYNPTDQFLEVEYSFPINPNACVYRFVADFGNNRI